MPSKRTPEGHLKLAVLEVLALHHIFTTRMNSGNLLISAPSGHKRMVCLAKKGTADMQCLIPDSGLFAVLWIETKVNTKLSLNQQAFRDEVVALGHFYLVAHSVDDVLAWLKNFRAGQR